MSPAQVDIKDGLLVFRRAILNALKPSIEKSFREHPEEIALVTWNLINNNNGPRRVTRILDPKERVLSKIMQGFLEIERSHLMLTEIPSYLKRVPSNSPSRARYLEFMITSYLNEVYIFRGRIDSFTTKIARLYRNSLGLEMQHAMTELGRRLSESLSGITNTRGRHVHQERYSDDDLDSLFYLEILIDDDSLTKYGVKTMYKKSWKLNRDKWLKIFHENQLSFQIVLDTYFTGLHYLIFDKTGCFLVPK